MSITKVLFSMSGRIPRQTYWVAILGIWAAYFVLAFFLGFISAAIDGGHKSSGPSLTTLLVPLYPIVTWCSLAVTIKRWHDRGKSGFWMLIGFIPFLGPLWSLIELGFLEGTQGPNEYDEGTFSNDVSLAEDDPMLSMPQIAGRQCVHCQQKIVSFIGAELCKECREPVHQGCCREHVTSAHRGPVRVAYP